MLFPLSYKKLLSAWLGRVRRQNFVPNQHTRTCSAHFEQSCYERDLQAEFAAGGEISGYNKRQRKRYLKPGSIPSLNLNLEENQLQSVRDQPLHIFRYANMKRQAGELYISSL